jgi:hypothetical protein
MSRFGEVKRHGRSHNSKSYKAEFSHNSPKSY